MRPAFCGLFAAALLLAGSVLTACQTDGGGGAVVDADQAARVSKDFYTPFFDQGDHLKDLAAVGNFNAAAQLFAEQQDYFAKKRAEHRETLMQVADQMKGPAEAALREAQAGLEAGSWPAPRADWATVRERLQLAEKALAAFPGLPLLNDPEFASSVVGGLEAKRMRLKAAIEADAPAQFAIFDHFGDQGFFQAYPVDMESPRLLADGLPALGGLLDGATAEQLARFSRNYPEADLGAEAWATLGGRHVAAVLRERTGGGKPNLAAVLDAIRKTREAGLRPMRVPGVGLAFVEVTSRTLLKHGQIEFPVAVDVDLPVDVVTAELDEALADQTAAKADFAIVFDVALAKTQRKVSGMRKMPARILAGYRTEPNPEYAKAQNQVTRAQMDYQRASLNSATAGSQYCYGMGCLAQAFAGMAAIAVEAAAAEAMNQAMAVLQATPMTVDIPVYQPYHYDLASVHAAKTTTVHYYVVDRSARTLFKSTFDVVEKKNFEVPYKIAEQDPEADEHRRAATVEEDVVAWEEAPATVALSQVVDHYLANAKNVKPLPELAALRAEMLRDKNEALARYREQTFEGSTQSDPRFDSVVVIYMPDGGLGSGFFVRPDVVMTNYHVVEEGQFAEMKIYGGQETFGKVIARDVRLDLALLRVQSRGKPVQFFDKNQVELGSTVEAIGHPRRLEFAITRGIISAVRELPAPNISGGKPVKQIQIDAAVSPGNSGGPVFLKDRAVGVVSWRMKESQNLNFVIHYAEALQFIRDSLGSGS
ncbi:MAG: serine protease [Rhodospirillales bacterium]|nr:serine protease [Rhodospirillales bacterium]